MPNLGPMELVLILGVALLLFGGRKLPELAKGMGEGIKNFKNALKEETPPPPVACGRQTAAAQLRESTQVPSVLDSAYFVPSFLSMANLPDLSKPIAFRLREPSPQPAGE